MGDLGVLIVGDLKRVDQSTLVPLRLGEVQIVLHSHEDVAKLLDADGCSTRLRKADRASCRCQWRGGQARAGRQPCTGCISNRERARRLPFIEWSPAPPDRNASPSRLIENVKAKMWGMGVN
jgi:hypothetical protein